MLAHIHIKNMGIIEDLEIEFEKGFNVLTGETGAGKTLIIGAIKMLTGAKVTKDIIRNGEDKAFVEALFYVENEELKKRILELGYDEDEVVIYRELNKTGRSLIKINGKLKTASELKLLGDTLIDLHGQNDNQSLLNIQNHIEVIDNFAGEKIKKLKEEYFIEYENRKQILEDIKKLGGNAEERERTIEFLKFQLDEISEANLVTGEEEELNNKRKILSNGEKIIKNLSILVDAFSSENGVINGLQIARGKLEELSVLDEKYNKTLEVLNEAYYELEDVEASISSELDNIFIDEEELNRVDERLDLIFKLKRKYGNSIDNILSTFEKLKSEYDMLCNSSEVLENLNKKLFDYENKLKEIGKKIFGVREEVSKSLEVKLFEVLKELEMPKSRFEIKVIHTDKFIKNGMDEVEILFSSNLGEEVKPLVKSASGGEISRIMLALKNVLSNADIIPVMVFDEIDTGISGKAGFAVGEKMTEIAKDKQVICVTHLPSIAGQADSNYYISKNNVENRTVTSVKKLNEEETIYEIARIISGGNISETALLHAKEIRKSKRK